MVTLDIECMVTRDGHCYEDEFILEFAFGVTIPDDLAECVRELFKYEAVTLINMEEIE